MEAASPELDLWIATDPENAERVYRALNEFGAPVAGHTPRDFTDQAFWRLQRISG